MGSCLAPQHALDYFRPGGWSLPGDALKEDLKDLSHIYVPESYYVDDDNIYHWQVSDRILAKISHMERLAEKGDITTKLYLASYYIYGISRIYYTGEMVFAKRVWNHHVVLPVQIDKARQLLEPMEGKHFAADALLHKLAIKKK